VSYRGFDWISQDVQEYLIGERISFISCTANANITYGTGVTYRGFDWITSDIQGY
jgi:hypothetical protein